MTYTPLEPDIRALANLCALLAAARVVDRRVVSDPRLGRAYQSEIALPGDPGYDAGGEKLAARVDDGPFALLTETNTLPLVCAFPDQAATVEHAQRVGDRAAFEVVFRVAAKEKDAPKNADVRARRRCLWRDLVYRLSVGSADLGVPGGVALFDAITETNAADSSHADQGYRYFDTHIVFAHGGEQLTS